MDWTMANTTQLIKLYEIRRVLWDTKHSLYYHQIIKHDAWEEIGRIVGCSGEECKKKINSLLSMMRKELAKIKKSMGSGKGKHCH